MITLADCPTDDDIARLEAEHDALYAGSTTTTLPDGTRIHTDRAPAGMGLDDRWVIGGCLSQMIEIAYEMRREATPLHDPNRGVEPRNVRRELGDRNTVNLGRRADRVPATAWRL